MMVAQAFRAVSGMSHSRGNIIEKENKYKCENASSIPGEGISKFRVRNRW